MVTGTTVPPPWTNRWTARRARARVCVAIDIGIQLAAVFIGAGPFRGGSTVDAFSRDPHRRSRVIDPFPPPPPHPDTPFLLINASKREKERERESVFYQLSPPTMVAKGTAIVKHVV